MVCPNNIRVTGSGDSPPAQINVRRVAHRARKAVLTWDNRRVGGCDVAPEKQESQPRQRLARKHQASLTSLDQSFHPDEGGCFSAEVPLKHTKHGPTCGDVRVTYLNREGHAWASCRTTGNPLDKAVIVFIGGRMNKHWAAFPGKAEIARATEIAEATVVKCIRRLELGGHLIRVAFAATNGADQKIGYVLAGCGRPLDSLDDEFLALAFADRKQPGVPRVAKPQHWSGERKGGRVAVGHPPRVADGYPPGGCGPPLEEKEHTEDQIEQEDTFGEAAFAAPSQKQAAIAEVRAGAPTPNRDHEVVAAATIPTQRQLRDRRSPIQQRDDDWAAQIAAADYGTQIGRAHV